MLGGMKFLLAVMVVALAGWCGAEEQTVRLKGGDAMGAKLVPQLVEAYKAAGNKEVAFQIVAEGSATAFAGLVDGSADIGMTSRPAKPRELEAARAKGLAFRLVPVCRDMLAVVVHGTNPLRALTRAQVAAIFTGDVKDWSEVGGRPGKISVYHRNTASSSYLEWKALAMDGRDYPPGAFKVAGSDLPWVRVAEDPNGISYVGFHHAGSRGIAAVAVDGVPPLPENVMKYPYVRVYSFVVAGKPSPAAEGFLEFSRGEEARKIMERAGFIPE